MVLSGNQLRPDMPWQRPAENMNLEWTLDTSLSSRAISFAGVGKIPTAWRRARPGCAYLWITCGDRSSEWSKPGFEPSKNTVSCCSWSIVRRSLATTCRNRLQGERVERRGQSELRLSNYALARVSTPLLVKKSGPIPKAALSRHFTPRSWRTPVCGRSRRGSSCAGADSSA